MPSLVSIADCRLSRRSVLQGAVLASSGRLNGITPAKEVLLPVPFSGPMPSINNGLISILNAELTQLSLVDITGKLVSSWSPRIPNSVVERIVDVAVSADRRVVMSLSARDSAGRYSFFLLFTDLSGNSKQLIQMHPFAPRRVLLLPGDRILCIGREYDSVGNDVPKHKMLRFYNRDGVFENSVIEFTLLRSGESDHPLHWLVARGRDTIGLVDTRNFRYCEIDFAGSVTRAPEQLGVTQPDRVTGVALLPNGDRLLTLDRPRLDGRILRHGYACAAIQVSGGAGQPLSTRTRPDLVPAVEGAFVFALGCNDGRPALLARSPDRLLIFDQ